MVKVSVIIPVYNAQDYIEETLETVVNQTLNDIEIIIINDGSTDNSQDIINKYCDKFENIVSVELQNGGVSRARNYGLSVSRGEFITFVDADDLLPLNSLEIRYNLAIQKDVDIVVGGTVGFNDKDTWNIETNFLGNGFKDIRFDGNLFWSLGPCNKLYRYKVVKGIKFPEDIKYAEDQVFVIESYLKSQKIYTTDEIVYKYRRTENSLSQKKFTKYINVMKQVNYVWESINNQIDISIKNKYISNQMKVKYLDRLLKIDVWPPLISAITSKCQRDQEEALSIMQKIITSLNYYTINNTDRLKWILVIGITEHYRFLKGDSKNKYCSLICDFIPRLDSNSIYKLDNKYSKLMPYIYKVCKHHKSYYIFQFLVKRKLKNINKSIINKVNDKLDKIIIKCIFCISKRTGIRKNKIVLATNRTSYIADNLQYINNELSKYNQLKVKLYLNKIRNKKLELIKMYYDFATAKYIIIDDYYRQIYGLKFNKKSEIIQVWHACGAFKKFAFSALNYLESNTEEFEKNAHLHYTKVITSDSNVNKHYSEAFRINEENILSLGIPRTDLFFDEQYKEYIRVDLENKYPNIKEKKVILYAPTFRGGGKARESFDLKLDFKKIINELGKDYIIILKLHPSVNKNKIEIPNEYKDNVINLSSYKNINDLLLISDILISDYSSVIFEYSLLEKPMIFYAYDLKSYIDERNFYYDYKEFVPGIIVYDNNGIIDAINNNKLDTTKIKEFRKKFMSNCDGKSTDRLVNFMMKYMEVK